LIRFIFLLLFPFLLFAKDVNISVIAISGHGECKREWTPTIEYLQEVLPQHTFNLYPIEPHNVEELKVLIKEQKIDFIITQPAIYIELELELGVSRILTMIKKQGLAEFGSVFITQKNSSIKELTDIKGKEISAVAPLGFGGWLIGYYELLEQGLDPLKEGNVRFVGTQTNVVKSVLSSETSLGVIRTGIIEKMQRNSFEGIENIRVVNAKSIDKFPLHVSTKLYPEWALAKTLHTSNNLSKEVASAFLSIEKQMHSAKAAGYETWTFPYNYQPVHLLMQELRIGAYEDYGKMSASQILYEYRYFVLIMMLSFVMLISFIWYVRFSDKRLVMQTKLKNEALEKINIIFDLQVSLLFVLKQDTVIKGNKAFLDFFTAKTEDDRVVLDKPIVMFFEDVEDSSYISYERYADEWIKVLLEAQMNYKVKIGKKIFSINLRKLPYMKENYIVMLSDISVLEDNKLYLQSQIEIAKEEIVEKERELFKQSKEAALGQLISVIAHQLKQPLGVVSVVLNKVLMDIDLDLCTNESIKEDVNKSLKSVSFMSSTIDEFRDFFKPNKPKKTFSLQECIHSVSNLLMPILNKHSIKIKENLDSSIDLHSYESELFHVIMNIINNAKDVLITQEVKEPEIYIQTKQEEDKILISIEDNAGGIDENIIDRIFEQYFTTKEDLGTGLGLHMSKMIVEDRLEGSIHVENTQQGARFSIILSS